MTACMYVSPNGVPGFIADTIISDEDTPTSYFLSPGDLSTRTLSQGLAPVQLARKLYLIDDDTCLAVSGSVNAIEDFLEAAPSLVRHHRSDEYPMRALGNHANNFEELSILGCQVRKSGEMYVTAPSESQFKAGHFGQCAVVGSGEEVWRKKTIEWGAVERTELQLRFGQELIRGVACAHNAKVLHDEFFGGLKQTWGGFCEFCYFDFDNGRWQFGPRSIYLHLHAKKINEYEFTFILLTRFILYEGNNTTGIVRSYSQLDGDNMYRADWILRGFQQDSSLGLNFANTWQPEAATFSMTYQDKRTRWHRHEIYTLDYVEMCLLKFGYIEGDDAFSVEINPILLHNLGQKFSERVGLNYSPNFDAIELQ